MALAVCGAIGSPGACAGQGAGDGGRPNRGRPPNVVLILADDLGYGELGCYGQRKIRTPRLDRLAQEGMRFTQYYAGAPVCAPSRACLLTGLHNGHSAVRDNHEIQPEGQMALPAESLTLAEALRSRGYRTAAFGKWGLGGPGSTGEPTAQGFDEFFGYLCQRQAHSHFPRWLWRDGTKVELPGNTLDAGPHHSHDLFVAAALEFLDRAEPTTPFFLYLPFALPHLALQVPEDSLAEYRGQFVDPPYDGTKGYRPHPTPRAAYAAMVSRLDRDVGRLVDRIDARGLGGDTLVLFTSDNGPTYDRLGGSDSEFFHSAAGFRGLKGSVHEGGLRVPLIARWTGVVPASRETAQVAAAWDLFPTLLALAGGSRDRPGGLASSPPPPTDGIDLAAVLMGAPAFERPPLYFELAGYFGGEQAVRFGDWKAVATRTRSGHPTFTLHDLARDPAEQVDLTAQRPVEAAQALELLQAQHAPHPSFPLFPGETSEDRGSR